MNSFQFCSCGGYFRNFRAPTARFPLEYTIKSKIFDAPSARLIFYSFSTRKLVQNSQKFPRGSAPGPPRPGPQPRTPRRQWLRCVGGGLLKCEVRHDRGELIAGAPNGAPASPPQQPATQCQWGGRRTEPPGGAQAVWKAQGVGNGPPIGANAPWGTALCV